MSVLPGESNLILGWPGDGVDDPLSVVKVAGGLQLHCSGQSPHILDAGSEHTNCRVLATRLGVAQWSLQMMKIYIKNQEWCCSTWMGYWNWRLPG